MEKVTGLTELETIEQELKANFSVDTTKDCATGTCS
jgi:hypothetical protein